VTATCTSYTDDAEALAAVERLIAEGTPGERISVLTGRLERDHREDRTGSFAGEAGAIGAFAGTSVSPADPMGSFAAAAGYARRGSFGDADRDVIATYEDGVRRVHVASHRELERVLGDAGLDADAIAADVAAIHHGRVLVLVAAA
jgi:hypothetical protein